MRIPLAAIARRLFGRPAASSNEASLRRARSIAFIAANRAEADRRRWIGEAEARGAVVDVLPLFQPYRREGGHAMSFLFAPPRPEYDCIVISHRIDLFEHSWSYAFLDRLNSLLSERGTILVPRRIDPTRQIPDGDLKALFGRAPRETGERHLTFEKAARGLRRPPDAAISILDAYWPLMDSLIHGRFDEGLADVILSLGPKRAGKRTEEDADDLIEILDRQSYRVCNVCTKAAMIQFIASVYFPDRFDLHLADLGAGAGFNSLELLLNPSRVSFVTLVEPNRAHHWELAAVYDWLGERVRGKVSLIPRPVENYAGRPAEIAVVCGVFSILPRTQRERFVLSAWNNLAPGGILAVLENMRKENPAKNDFYNATRYSPPEIDALLGRFAPIRYFHNRALKELAFAEVGNETVFRVVRKQD